MAQANELNLGQPASTKGFVTRFDSVGANEPGRLDSLLGYKAGTLAAGYHLLVLAQPVRPNHVKFAAYTYASDGRWGKPTNDPGTDRLRPSVHDGMEGLYDISRLQKAFAEDPRNLSGPGRIVKIVPVAPPKGDNPADDYPVGLGIAQWQLTDPHTFLVALYVDPMGVAKAAEGWSVTIGPNAPYDNRARAFQCISNLKV